MTTQHTPAPWRASFENEGDEDNSLAQILARNSSMLICEQARIGDEDKANFHLIAAAPDLFAVALALQEWGRQLGGWEAPVWTQLDEAITKARPPLPRFRVDGKDKYGAWLGIDGNGDLIAAPFAIFDSDTQDHLPERFDSSEAAQAVADKLNSEPAT